MTARKKPEEFELDDAFPKTISVDTKLLHYLDINCALIAQSICYWQNMNSKNRIDTVYKNNFYWVKRSHTKLAEAFNLTPKQCKDAINKLKNCGFIEVLNGQNNNINYYRITDEFISFIGKKSYEVMTKYNNEKRNPGYNNKPKNTINNKFTKSNTNSDKFPKSDSLDLGNSNFSWDNFKEQ